MSGFSLQFVVGSLQYCETFDNQNAITAYCLLFLSLMFKMSSTREN